MSNIRDIYKDPKNELVKKRKDFKSFLMMSLIVYMSIAMILYIMPNNHFLEGETKNKKSTKKVLILTGILGSITVSLPFILKWL